MPYSYQTNSSRFCITDSLVSFLNDSRNTYSSNAIYIFKYYLLRELDSSYTKKLNETVFSKIYSISETDDGYVVINDNQKLKLGKLIVKMADELKINIGKSESIAIEDFVDEYKSWYKSKSTLKFKVLKGQDVLCGYNREYHAKSNGMLRGSCMNNKPELLNLYTDNEEKVELLVLINDRDVIYGRSLLWKLDNIPFVFMDRVYGVDNYINNIFVNYAKEHKMIYREQCPYDKFDIYLPNGKTVRSDKYPMKVKLYSKHLNNLPYMDSLYIWNKWTSTFGNTKTETFMKFHRLKSTYGKLGKPGLKILGLRIKNSDD